MNEKIETEEKKLDFSDEHFDPYDYSTQETIVEKPISPEQVGEYDPREGEDKARKNIAYALIGLLWLIVLGILILTSFGSIQLSEIKEFGVILGPVIALVSAATGFYYGTKKD